MFMHGDIFVLPYHVYTVCSQRRVGEHVNIDIQKNCVSYRRNYVLYVNHPRLSPGLIVTNRMTRSSWLNSTLRIMKIPSSTTSFSVFSSSLFYIALPFYFISLESVAK